MAESKTTKAAAPDPDPNDFVMIQHPEVEGLGGPVTRQAFETVHQHKGWKIVSEDEAAKAEEEARIAALKEDES